MSLDKDKKKKKAFYVEKFNILIFALLLIILVPGYLFFIKPQYSRYQKNKELFNSYNRKREQNLNLLSSHSKSLNNYQTISRMDEQKINEILPDNYEEASLYVNLESIVASLDIALDSISIEQVKLKQSRRPVIKKSGDLSSKTAETIANPKENIKYVKIELDLSHVSYHKLKELFVLIENNLRLLDVTNFSFNPGEATLSISLKAYYNQ